MSPNRKAPTWIANNIGGIPPFGQATLKNTLVARGKSGADIADGAIVFGSSSFVDGGHNLIGNIGTVTTFGVVASPVNGNLVGDSLTPINPQLDTLRDNGGPTLTHALLFGSPARDAGLEQRTDGFPKSSGCPTPEPFEAIVLRSAAERCHRISPARIGD